MLRFLSILVLLCLYASASVTHITNQTGAGAQISVPADTVFTSDSGGTTLLPGWEFETYTPGTGAATFFVNVPSVTTASDAAFYSSYNNPGVTTWQGNVAGTWNSHFSTVHHLTTINGCGSGNCAEADSTSNANTVNGAITSQPAGALGLGMVGALSTGGSFPIIGFASGSSPRTLEAWFNRLGNSCSGTSTLGGWGVNSKDNQWTITCGLSVANSYSVSVFTDFCKATATLTIDSNWHHAVATLPSGMTTVSGSLLYLDGVAVTTTCTGGGDTVNTTADGVTACGSGGACWAIGDDPHQPNNPFTPGALDEMRASTVEESPDWIATTYNNIHNVGTFTTVGAEDVSCTPASGYLHCRKITIDHTQVPNTNQTNFPVALSGTFPWLAVGASGNIRHRVMSQ